MLGGKLHGREPVMQATCSTLDFKTHVEVKRSSDSRIRREVTDPSLGRSKMHRMSEGYAYDHAWTEERIRLAGLESALDPGTRAHLVRLGAGLGSRCLEVGAGGGAVALWLAGLVAPEGKVVATDLETDFLEAEAADYPTLEVLRHDITAEELQPASTSCTHGISSSGSPISDSRSGVWPRRFVLAARS